MSIILVWRNGSQLVLKFEWGDLNASSVIGEHALCLKWKGFLKFGDLYPICQIAKIKKNFTKHTCFIMFLPVGCQPADVMAWISHHTCSNHKQLWGVHPGCECVRTCVCMRGSVRKVWGGGGDDILDKIVYQLPIFCPPPPPNETLVVTPNISLMVLPL